MAGDWIKMRARLPEERATMLICDLTGLDEFAVVGRLHSLWSWAGEHTTDGTVLGVTVKTIDRLARCDGFGAAMIAAAWLEELPDGVRFPRWDKYNSRAAKERAMAAKRQSEKRWRDEDRDGERDATVTCHDAREEKRGEEKISSREETDRVVPSTRKIWNGKKDRGAPLDLSQVDERGWAAIGSMAEQVAKRVPVRTDDDRRAWIRYAVLAFVRFSEAWLVGAADAAKSASEPKKSRQAIFVRSLQNSADDVDVETFNEMAARIEIPDDIWKSNILKGSKNGQ